MWQRSFDIIISFLALVFLCWLILLLWFISLLLFRKNGFFFQPRVGRNKEVFYIIKIRSLANEQTTQLNKYSKFIRQTKLDELPQFFNVLLGDMAIVGPRPELQNYFIKYDYPKDLLRLKPGITGLASLYFINEVEIKNKFLNQVSFDTWMFNRKVKLNMIYLKNKNLCFDIKIIYMTALKILFKSKFSI